ncbi:peptidoglycan recognition protein [Streptomyces sp. NPDC046215]|uniref:Peptidoglycan recognition protein family domain-containing protein n=1 Tax=Streptomyces stramineus TaxID=173861 RepID=A0ABN1AGB7_9ACTN
MRGILVSSTVTACAAALTLPFLASSPASPATSPERPGARGSVPAALRPVSVPGSTQSLPLVTLGTADRARVGGPAKEQGLPQQEVEPFSLVGIVWDDATAELRGRAQVRTRAVGSGAWSGWQDVQTHDDDRPDLGSPEARGGRLRGSTAPLWVGASDAIQVRVRPDALADRTPEGRSLPAGLRLELVDPGVDPAPARGARAAAPPDLTEEELASSTANLPLAPLGATEIPALDKPASEADIAAAGTGGRRTDDPAETTDTTDTTGTGGLSDIPDLGELTIPRVTDLVEEAADSAEGADPQDDSVAAGGRYVGPRPRIVTRAGWGADESLREKGFSYTKRVRAAFVHHTASGNRYTCAQSSSVIRGIYRYHVVSSGWRDLGYNFLLDKCGSIYEGRAGGVAKAVLGAHTLGFNSNSMGIAVLGSFGTTNPPAATVKALASLTAWKLGLFGANPLGTTTLVSAGGNLFKKGTSVKLKVISGHRDGYATECPGDRLYGRLGAARTAAARLQGR